MQPHPKLDGCSSMPDDQKRSRMSATSSFRSRQNSGSAARTTSRPSWLAELGSARRLPQSLQTLDLFQKPLHAGFSGQGRALSKGDMTSCLHDKEWKASCNVVYYQSTMQPTLTTSNSTATVLRTQRPHQDTRLYVGNVLAATGAVRAFRSVKRHA